MTEREQKRRRAETAVQRIKARPMQQADAAIADQYPRSPFLPKRFPNLPSISASTIGTVPSSLALSFDASAHANCCDTLGRTFPTGAPSKTNGLPLGTEGGGTSVSGLWRRGWGLRAVQGEKCLCALRWIVVLIHRILSLCRVCRAEPVNLA